MDRRRKFAALAAVGTAITGFSSALLTHTETIGGLSSDFWRGFPTGLGIGLTLVALIALVKDKRSKNY